MTPSIQYLTNEQGERTAVLLSIEEYEEMLDDLADMAAIAERRNDPLIPHAEVVAELKRDGLL